MDTFDGSKPNLISSKTLKDIEFKLDTQSPDEGNRVLNGLGSFYENYVSPNMFPIIVIVLLILYLTIKYILKKDREEKEEEEEEKSAKRERIKKKMVNVDPDEVLKNTGENIGKKKQKEDVDISDMISDDYLLTDDDSMDENENNDKHQQSGLSNLDPLQLTQGDMMLDNNMLGMSQYDVGEILQGRDTMYDMNKAAALIFGK